jgi:hypothetical protein
MSESREIAALRDAIEAFAAQRAPELVAEARTEAVAKARSMLVDAMAEALLTRAGETLGPPRPARAAKPKPRHEPKPRAPRSAQRPSRRPSPEPPAPAPAAPRDDDELGFYVYGVVGAPGPELPDGLAAVDRRHPVEIIEHSGLAAIGSRVPLAEFGEEQLHENLNDVEWLEDKARAHEEVLDAALARATVVPLRLCTIYRGEPQVRAMLDGEGPLFHDALERLEGRTEWGVKLVAAPGALRAAAATASDSAAESRPASEGTAYIQRKQREADTRDDEDRIAVEWAQDVHERAAERAAEALLNPLQRPEVAGYEGEMLLNGVYLVADADVDGFRSLVEELGDEYRRRGAQVDLTGPWPPYNFVKGSIEAAR